MEPVNLAAQMSRQFWQVRSCKVLQLPFQHRINQSNKPSVNNALLVYSVSDEYKDILTFCRFIPIYLQLVASPPEGVLIKHHMVRHMPRTVPNKMCTHNRSKWKVTNPKSDGGFSQPERHESLVGFVPSVSGTSKAVAVNERGRSHCSLISHADHLAEIRPNVTNTFS